MKKSKKRKDSYRKFRHLSKPRLILSRIHKTLLKTNRRLTTQARAEIFIYDCYKNAYTFKNLKDDINWGDCFDGW